MCAIHAATIIPIAYATAVRLTEGSADHRSSRGLLLKERVLPAHWVAGLAAAAGAYLLVMQSLREVGATAASIEGMIYAAAGALFIALEVLMIKVLARCENALGVLLHVNGFGTLVVGALSLLLVDWPSIDLSGLLPFLLLGPTAIIAQFFNILAFSQADAATLGPVSYAWILFATLMGIVFFDEIPAPAAFLGAALIVTGGLIAARTPAAGIQR